jgi:hypothetical protein
MPRTAQSSTPRQPTGRLVFSDTSTYTELSRQQRAGNALKLAPGVYALDATLPATAVTAHHLWAIVAHFWPGAVICDRSALAGGVDKGWLYICHPQPGRRADLRLPGVSVTCRAGFGPLAGDMTWPEGLYLSGIARGLVENISVGGRPAAGRPARAAGETAVGDRVDNVARSGESGKVADTLAQLEAISDRFAASAVSRARELLVAALGTVPERPIVSPRLAARVAGEPYDAARVELFGRVRDDIERLAPSVRPERSDPAALRWLPFFEAYFSNYIEGTRFSVTEAHDIAILGLVPAGRPEDAHDVSATFRIVSDPAFMQTVPSDADSFLDLLVERHRTLMEGRAAVNPGQFKTRANFAGGTEFVSPETLVGTLRAGWEHIDSVVDPFHRAVMMMFVVTECHPFDDGNGRLARIMTNAELVARSQARIIIANSYRGNYLAGLTGASANAGGRALVGILEFSRRWVSAVDWSSWDRCMADLESSNAFLDSALAERSGERLRLPHLS